jgi:hypothetical protein
MINMRYIAGISMAATLFLSSGCTYSFKGGSVPPHLKTVAIPIVEDQSGYGDPTLRDSFTKELVEQFTNDNTLQLTDRNLSDSMIEGIITDVKDAPLVLQSGEQVVQRRITVTVHIKFQDMKLRKVIWEKDFNNWGNYDSGGSLTKRNDGVAQAVKKIAEDVLNETVAGW